MSDTLNRRHVLTGISLGASLLFLPRTTRAEEEHPIAETAAGRVRGTSTDGVEIYRGIPYAGDASGTHRFGPPPPLQPWNGVRDALVAGPPSIQPPGARFTVGEPEPNENCLSVTVWTPARDDKRRPVMFYSHGGGYDTGSAAGVIQDGSNLARRYEVVVVATNHRLGLLGYLYLGGLPGADSVISGNQQLLDLVAGLTWVRKNIASFGGDPHNVMLFGESGGGWKTSCLYAMPLAAHLFNKASIESGPGIRVGDLEGAERTTRWVLEQLGIAPTDWQKLFDIPVARLLEVQQKLRQEDHPLGPIVDGRTLPRHPFDPDAPAISKHKPLIVGYNKDEYTFFAVMGMDKTVATLDERGLRERLAKEMPDDYEQAIAVYRQSRPEASPADIYIAIRSAQMMGNGSVTIAERKAQQRGAPAYAYIFDYEVETPIPGTSHPIGAMHGMDIPFKFDNVETTGKGMSGQRPEKIQAARNMSEMWTTFARTGVPVAKGQPSWSPYSLDTRTTMIIDAACRVADDPYPLERRFWQTRQKK
jgi:para-nitrobenzyl esterase